MKNTTKREKLMAYLTATATADSEEDVEKLLGLFNPVEDRSEMGDIFEETLGYNPITHYDMADIVNAVDSAIEHVSAKSLDLIKGNQDAIAKRALEIYEQHRDLHIKEAVSEALAEFLPADDAVAARHYLIGGEPEADFEEEEEEDAEETDDIASNLDDVETGVSIDDDPLLEDDDEEYEFDTGEDDDE